MKRFTETEKWRDPWYRKLPLKAKILWQFLCDNCDKIGFIHIDWEGAGFSIGQKVSESDLAALGSRVQKVGDDRYFIPSFIAFQYGTLTPSCRPHVPILALLDNFAKQYPDRVSVGYPIPTSRDNTIQDKIGEGGVGETTKRKDRGTLSEVQGFCISIGLPPSDGDSCFHKWEGNGWTNDKKPIKDWRATIRSWKAAGYLPSQKPGARKPMTDMMRGLHDGPLVLEHDPEAKLHAEIAAAQRGE